MTIPGPFIPVVLFPALFFVGIFLWPFIEQRITGDDAPHHLLDRARDAPWRSGVGAGVLAFAVILTVGGSNDVLARAFGIPVEWITLALRMLLLVVPPVAGYVTYAVCRELGARDEAGPEAGMRWVRLRRSSRGGFEEGEPTSREKGAAGGPPRR